MEDVHRSLLQRVSFRKDLEPKKSIPYLRQDKILDENDEQQIKNQPTREDQVDKMLDILPRRGPLAFQCLVDALENVQPHLADFLRESEEMEKKLSKERCNSAKLRDKLRDARVKLEQLELEKNKQENKRKQLEELLHQSENEKEKLISNIIELKNMKERLTKDLEEEKQERLTLQSKYSDLEEELQSKSKVIERLETSFQRNDAASISSKVSADELGSREKPPLFQRGRANSARSEQNPKERVDVEYVRYLMADRDHAKACVEKQLKCFEEKQMSKMDKATTPMNDTGLNTCSKCIEHESEYNRELQQAKEKTECKLKEVESSLQQLKRQYNTAKLELDNDIEMLRNEMNVLTVKHDSDMKDIEISLKYKLECQVEKSKVTIVNLKRELTRERNNAKTANKRFDKYKKKTNSKIKELEEDIKSKALRLKVLEAELKEAKDEGNKGLQNMNKSKATLKGQQDMQEELRDDELTRQKKLPGS